MSKQAPAPEPSIWLPAWRIAEMVQRREVSAVEVVRAHLERIRSLDGELHAFVTAAHDEALRRATAVDDAVSRGEPVGPLAGVPVAVKDEVWTAGIRSTAGSLLYEDFVPSEEGTAITRVYEAGGVVIGKTQMPEFAMWPRSANLVAGEARNPWNPSRISGASSGGSAVAVATGMAPLAIGSDGGGSTRIPAALCGVVGFHPTPGSVPDDRTFSYSPLASLGALARDARDAALLTQVLQGTDGLVQATGEGVEGLRIAWTPDYGWIDADPRVVEVARRALEALEAAGAVVEEPGIRIDDIWPVFRFASLGMGGPVPYVQSDENLARVRAHPEKLSPPVAAALLDDTAPPVSADDAVAEVERIVGQVRSVLDRYDVICSPTMPLVAPRIPDGWDTPYPTEHMGTWYLSVINALKGTAASHPAGLVDGLPVGLHVAAGPGAERTVARVLGALPEPVALPRSS